MRGAAIDLEALASLARREGLPLPPPAVAPLAAYLETLCQWNAAMNLVGPRRWEDIFTGLVADSLRLAPFLDALPLPAVPLCWDLGAGAGLPGIPLRLVWTRGVYWLVEAREKRAIFLSAMLARLGLPDTHVHRGRAEAFFACQERPADLILSRAFMPWRRLLQFARPALAANGLLVILAAAPAPPTLPGPWRLTALQAYAAAGARRWFWALAPRGDAAA